jgi:hypothetical protein
MVLISLLSACSWYQKHGNVRPTTSEFQFAQAGHPDEVQPFPRLSNPGILSALLLLITPSTAEATIESLPAHIVCLRTQSK